VDILSFILGAGGLAVAALGLVLSHRERTKGLREHIYQRQVEACLDLYEASARLYVAMESAWVREADAKSRGRAVDRKRFWQDAWEASRALSPVDARWSPILPEAVIRSFLEFAAAVGFVMGSDPQLGLSPEGYGEEPYDEAEFAVATHTAFDKLAWAIRDHIGAEQLGADTLRLVGTRHNGQILSDKKSPSDT
jgi:hypothetical protein